MEGARKVWGRGIVRTWGPPEMGIHSSIKALREKHWCDHQPCAEGPCQLILWCLLQAWWPLPGLTLPSYTRNESPSSGRLRWTWTGELVEGCEVRAWLVGSPRDCVSAEVLHLDLVLEAGCLVTDCIFLPHSCGDTFHSLAR